MASIDQVKFSRYFGKSKFGKQCFERRTAVRAYLTQAQLKAIHYQKVPKSHDSEILSSTHAFFFFFGFFSEANSANCLVKHYIPLLRLISEVVI